MVMPRTFAALAQATGGRLAGSDGEFGTVISDSRRMEAGALFVCLRGPHFDGHEFAEAAAAAGAAGFLASRELAPALPCVEVEDSAAALARFAQDWRAAQAARVVAITGSNGKTTTKDLLAAILAQVAPTLATIGNLNNLIGVPLTLARLGEAHRYAVVELGTNAPGEIARLGEIARPDAAIVTSIGPAHLEGFGTVDGVAREKGSLFAALAPDGLAVVPAGSPWLESWRAASVVRRWVGFGLDADAEVTAHSIEAGAAGMRFTLVTPDGSAPVSLRLLGRHNVSNALAAAAAAWGLGVPPDSIGRGLALAGPAAGRLVPRRLASGVLLLDDSYNANPASVTAAVATAAALEPEVWLVLGDLAELGSGAAAWHRALAAEVRAAGATRLFALGPLAAEAADAFGADGESFVEVEALAAAVAPRLVSGVAVVVKGSRSARMERVVAALAAEET
ncbi:MAG TPA: UDP-N-acetylmuramoyl-tripeptide--D-alanyl-D-alanine ligase [Gammaproteobacteria bacterium]|nr:UDP-N-acetylmuramoyl-tripeptide--D-alanyl-D-alanine ligase [Gammaproteobacteria bacterium]